MVAASFCFKTLQKNQMLSRCFFISEITPASDFLIGKTQIVEKFDGLLSQTPSGPDVNVFFEKAIMPKSEIGLYFGNVDSFCFELILRHVKKHWLQQYQFA